MRQNLKQQWKNLKVLESLNQIHIKFTKKYNDKKIYYELAHFV